MKILIVNISDIQGGAARAAYRLHRALVAEGIDSRMLVQSKSSDDYTVTGPETKVQKALGLVRPVLDIVPVGYYKNRTQTLFSPAWLPFSGLVGQINALAPDVVHLQWVAGGMLRIEELARIKAPVVWTLHDMWPFTGGCHYDEGCAGYEQACGRCPVLRSNTAEDMSRKGLRRKQKVVAKLPKMIIVGISSWLAECAASSSVFKNHRVVHLPNLIDTQLYAPFGQIDARRLLNLPTDKKLILFGAIRATSDPRKGFLELTQALQDVPEDHELVVFGSGEPGVPYAYKQKVHYLGYLHDDVSLRVLYSAADVMVVPSLQEAFGQTASESMACGTPVVAFRSTGLLDIVDHRENGFLAEPFDTRDLARGVRWVLEHPNPEHLARSARQKVLQAFDRTVVAKQYIALYNALLG
jgi:glycosyltransferase involved in cell wall biosynthesis